MTNEDKIRAINLHQNFSLVHPLTCGREGCRADLKPLEREGEVVLECPVLECGYVQEWIPKHVFDIEGLLESYERQVEYLGVRHGPVGIAIDYARERADEANK